MSCVNEHSEDEFANLPDDFSGIDFDNINDLAPVPTVHPAATTPVRLPVHASVSPSSTTSSLHYSSDYKIDAAFIQELDRMEGLAQAAHASKQSRFFSDTYSIRDTSVDDLSPINPHKSRKRHSNSSGRRRVRARGSDVRQALEGMEDEMTCPICCELFIAAHVNNPCGHTLCGECGWQWVSKNKKAPTCAFCRAALNKTAPIIPNITLDNTVEKHIDVLASNGDNEWKAGGNKMADRNARKEKWKAISAERAAQQKKKTTRRGRNVVRMDDDEFLNWLRTDEDRDETYYNSDDGVDLLTVTRTTRSRR